MFDGIQMQSIVEVALLTLMAGAAIPAGALLARIERLQPDWLEQELRHSVIAFGGGVLLAAVALVLVPDGMRDVSNVTAVVAFVIGGVSFCGLDLLLARHQGSAAQLAATLADFVPEAIALGAGAATGSKTVMLLAVLIALQNLPEGFNAYRERIAGGSSPRSVIVMFIALVPLGPIAGLLGLLVLSPYTAVVGVIMLFAAGGILYLTFQDIAPQARLEHRWAPSLGAVAGFVAGLIGQMLLH